MTMKLTNYNDNTASKEVVDFRNLIKAASIDYIDFVVQKVDHSNLRKNSSVNIKVWE